MLEIIDADLGRFAITDRTQVPGDFQPAFVRLFYRRAQLFARDIHVGFERRCALVSPVVHHTARIVSSSELMHHWGEGAGAFQVRPGDVHLWTKHPTRIDQLLDFQIVVRLNTAGGANRRHPEGEVETRKTCAHVRIHRRRAAHRKEHVVVHAD